VTAVDAWEVLDSRGDPTVRAAVEAGDARGTFTVPSGASTGEHEAVELRDGGDRFDGRGVRTAVENVREELGPVAVGRDVTDQAGIDAALVERDGTESLSRLGANAVLAVSGAAARAAAAALSVPPYEYVSRLGGGARDEGRGEHEDVCGATETSLPLPMVNVLSGGLHAEGGIEVQDFLIVPVGAESYPEALEIAWDVRNAVRERIVREGGRPLVADEGGFAPPLSAVEDAFDRLVAGIREAGYRPGDDAAIAVDVAASHFYDADAGEYVLSSLDRRLDRDGMIDLVAGWVDRFPVVSIEDPLEENDWAGWRRLGDRLGDRVQLLGDDLLVTDRERLERARETGSANAALVKPNQAGTVTRAVEVVRVAQQAGMAPVVSARSGETADATIADLAVGLDAGQIKIGSLARSERLAKYNRLLGIDRAADLPFPGRDALAP
jgi:enolase